MNKAPAGGGCLVHLFCGDYGCDDCGGRDYGSLRGVCGGGGRLLRYGGSGGGDSGVGGSGGGDSGVGGGSALALICGFAMPSRRKVTVHLP